MSRQSAGFYWRLAACVLWFCWSSRSVADAENDDLVAGNAITDDVGIGRHDLAHGGSRDHAAAMREINEAIADLTNILCHSYRRLRIEIVEVVIRARDAVKRRFSPNNAHSLCPWCWCSLAFGQFCEPLIDAFMRHNFTCRVGGLGLRIETRFVCLIRLKIENRFQFSF